ncbi:MAG: PAS domain-containing sensor histidine kinase [Candidatus Electryonea clarkiae]|nr:PAS domain-containing sensor histidine kinase [Candidatus Electryonea clarkiae]MDP8288375.1 PAS domain-containing sensor histidine kinase [Candidatus Electryonea clarkiae]
MKSRSLRVFQVVILVFTILILIVINKNSANLPTNPRSFPNRLSYIRQFNAKDTFFPSFNGGPDIGDGFLCIHAGEPSSRFLQCRLYSADFHCLKEFFLDDPATIKGKTKIDLDLDGMDEILLSRRFKSDFSSQRSVSTLDSLQLCYCTANGKEVVFDVIDARELFPKEVVDSNPVSVSIGYVSHPGGRSAASNGEYFAVNFWALAGDKYFIRGVRIYRQNKTPEFVKMVPSALFTSSGTFGKTKNGEAVYTFSGRVPFNGHSVDVQLNDCRIESLVDSLGTVVQVDMEGNVRWIRRLLCSGGNVIIYPQKASQEPITVIYIQSAYTKTKSQLTTIFRLRSDDGTIIDSTTIDGTYHQFFGYAIEETGLAGLVQISASKVRIVHTDGHIGPKITVMNTNISKYMPLLKCPDGSFVFLAGFENRLVYMYSINGKAQAVIEGVPTKNFGRFEVDGKTFDRPLIKNANDSHLIEMYEITRTGSTFPWWWFYRYRWSILIVILMQSGGAAIFHITRSFLRLRKSKERFRELYNEAPVAYFSVGIDGQIKEANRTAEKLTGYSINQLINRYIINLYANTPEGRNKAKEVFKRFSNGEKIENEEIQMVKVDGEIIWVSLNISPVFDNQSNVIESRSTVIDITTRKRAEEKQNEARRLAEETARLSSIGVMAGGITHEINQPLNVIALHAGTIKYIFEHSLEISDEEKMALVNDILGSTGRISNIIKQMRSFWTAPIDSEQNEIDLNLSIENSLQLTNNQLLSHSIRKIIDLSEQELPIHGNTLQIEQVIINMIVNSIHALDESSAPDKWIRIQTKHEADFAVVTIIDNGIGLPEDSDERLFDPFYSTGKSKEGTGLGLAIVKMFVDKFNGKVTGKNNEWGGATFQVSFPLVSHSNTNQEMNAESL